MKRHFIGPLLILASAVFFGSYGIWSKMMMGAFDEFTQGWTRSLLILCVLVPYGTITKAFTPMYRKDLHWWLIYAVPGSLVVPFYYYGFAHLPIGTATLIFYASLTVASYILGFLFFGEKMSWVKYLALFLGISGLGIIYAKSVTLDTSLVLPFLVTAASGICGGIEVVFTKKLSDRYSPIQLTIFLFILSLALCLGLSYVVHGFVALPISPMPWIGNILHAVATTAAFFLVILGYKHIEPSVGSIIGLTEILFGIVFGLVLFNEQLTTPILIGCLCICIAAALPNIAELNRTKTKS